MSHDETIDSLRQRIDELVRQRQELRDQQAGADALERNRRDLARAQQLLSHALIALHAVPAA